MNLHLNIMSSTGQLFSAVDLDKNKNFLPTDPGGRFETRTVTTSKKVFEKIKPTIGLGALSPVIIEPDDFFEANFEPLEGVQYLCIENESLKELTQKAS